MEEARWRRVSSLFAAALERQPGDRAAFLRDADPDLCREVESLIKAHDAVGPLDRLAVHLDRLRSDAFAGPPPELPTTEEAAGERVPALEPGSRLGRHEIRARLSAGGMGEIYRGFDTRLRRDVAIKVLGRGLQRRPGALQRFEQEARAASAINHPNIITLFDIGEEASFPYLVMELVEGESLREMLSGPWPIDLLLYVASQVADGLVAAHERQIVHGDLKPENILVSRQGIAKIVDFGLAQFWLDQQATDADSGPPRWPAPIGTPGYLSPEQVSGGPVDLRSDQFSLGAILYEMATGCRAFAAATTFETLSATLRDTPPLLAGARPALPEALVRVITRCLQKAAGDRYPSTRTVLDELRAARRDLGLLAPSGSPRREAALPAQRTRLIGRTRELEEVQRLVVEGDVRLVTLTGPGGTGKTRLALQVAELLSPRFSGGVSLVPLAPIRDPALVVDAIARALGGVAATARSPLSGVIAVLRNTNAPALLVLDNFEQVMDATPTVSELLAACPDLTLLVTSREGLNLYGEHVFRVSTLELPDPDRPASLDALADNPAVALFVERARAVNAGFCLTIENGPAVAALCAGLDGLPLALELAAAQARVLSPEAMLSRMEHRLELLTGGPRDLPGRQQTLRRTIDWSHQLLDATEQAVFRRLAVFSGGFTLEAAQAVADPYGRLARTLEDGLAALVNKSLIQAREPVDGEPRFAILETLREYVLEKLADSGETEKTRKAHAAYFVVLAEEGSAALLSSEQPQWLKRFEMEQDNFRTALEWLTREGNAEWGLRLALAMFHCWERGQHLAEGRRHLEALLDLEATRTLPAQRAKAMFAAAVLAHTQGDVEGGIRLQTQCLELYRELDDQWGIVVALVGLGNHCVVKGEYQQARNVLEQSLEVWKRLGDHAGYARSLSNLAFVARSQTRFDEARRLYQRAASMFRRLGDQSSCAWAVNHEGDVARDQGDLDAARTLYEDALASFRSLGDSWGIGSSLADLGAIARQRADYASAERLYREGLGRFVDLDHRRGIARLLESLACLAAEQGQAARALTLAAAAAGVRDRVGAPSSPPVRADLDRSLGPMREQLGTDAARRVWREGAALTFDEALRLATAG